MSASGAILSDIQILNRLVAESPDAIFVSPLVSPETQLGPSSLDLHLGTDLYSTKRLETASINLSGSREELKSQVERYLEPRAVALGDSFVIHPGELILASALEYIQLPNDIAGRLEGRSSIGRLGLQVHATAGFVDPGFHGSLTFELINGGNLPVELRPGIRIGQICFFCVSEVQLGYTEKKLSKYGGHLGVEASRIWSDPEVGD